MRYVFDSYTLDTQRHELLRDDRPVKLRPKVFQVLLYLIAHRDRMVPKGELLETIWPNIVGEEVLNSCVMAARRAIGDDGRTQGAIKTMHGVGYRFVARVRECAHDPVEATPEATEAAGALSAVGPEPGPTDAGLSARGGAPAGLLEISREQKTVTVLDCAVAEADALAERIGAEAMHDFMERFFGQARAVMDRYEGTVVQWLGDGFLALFGAPAAHEDDARRAALAGLDLCAALEPDGAPRAEPRSKAVCRLSVGLNTGPVIVGSLEESPLPATYTARGKTTDTAARLRSAAPQGAVLASDSTYRLIETEFDATPWTGGPDLPAAYRVLGVSQRRAGVPQRRRGQPSRFVGRAQEIAILRERLSRAEAGSGQIVCISGAPGIGKSRLLEEFRQGLAPGRFSCLEGHCLPYGTNTPYLPLVELVRSLCEIGESHDASAASARIRGCLGRGEADGETVGLALELLGIPGDHEPLGRLSPQARRARTFALLENLVFAAAATRPTVIALEDLHWVDATSEEWLSGLVTRLGQAPLLLVVTYRPPYSPEWLGRSLATQLALPPLTRSDSALLVRSILSCESARPELTEGLVAKSDGNPFFLEELSHALDAPSSGPKLGAIPDTVQAVLASRIDRLEPLAKRILQACSVIGTPVPHELLVNVSAMGEDALDAGLRTLEEAELLFELRGYRDRAYRFKHALTQEATYRSLPKHTCTQLHALIAEILERRFDHIVATQPEALARHHAGAGNATAAVGYWQRAARKAYERSANVEAIGYAREGLDLLTSLASEDDRSQQELALQLTLAPALMAARGYGAAEVGPVYRRAQELCREIGDSRQLFRALVGLWNFHWVRGELETARDVAKQLLDLAQHAGDPARALRAHAATGEILFHLGDLEGSLRHLEKGISLYDAAPQRTYATQIPAVVCLSYAAWALWHLGYPERSLRRTEEAVALAEQLSHPMSLALSLTLKAELHQFQLQVVDCLTAAERALAVSRDLRLPFWEGTATTILGWAQAMAGDFDRGHRTLQAGLEIFIGTGARVQRTAWLGMLAEIRCHGERFEEGLDAVREALSWVGETGEQYYYSELLRLQGELLLGHDKIHGAAAAEKSFRSAIEVARRQGARMRELRAAVSLTRLLRDQGKTVSALALLQPVRSWLADAEGTIDAANARALMDSLS